MIKHKSLVIMKGSFDNESRDLTVSDFQKIVLDLERSFWHLEKNHRCHAWVSANQMIGFYPDQDLDTVIDYKYENEPTEHCGLI